MATLVRRISLLIGWVAFLGYLLEVFQHQSDDPSVLQRYSASFTVWVLFYLALLVLWLAILYVVFFRWEWLLAWLGRISQNERKSLYLWFGLPAAWLILLGFEILVKHIASTMTPHSASVTLVMTFLLICYVLMQIAGRRGAQYHTDGGIEKEVVARLQSLADRQGVKRIAQWLSADERRRFVPFAVITLVTLILFAPALTQADKLLAGGDIQALFYPIESFITATVREGNIPLWNPYMFSGIPLLSHPDAIVFYPTHLILRLFLPVTLALAWSVAFHFWVAGMGMYALCRHLKIRMWIALICALTFMLNGAMILRLHAGHVWLVYALALMPLAWLLLMHTLEKRNLLALVGCAVVVAILILSGHPTFPGYILIFLGLYMLWVAGEAALRERSWKPLIVFSLKFVAIVVLAIGFAAIQLVPSAIFSAQTSLQTGYGLEAANRGVLYPIHLGMIFLPDAFPFDYPSWTLAMWEKVPYVGVLMPLAALWAYGHQRHRSLAIFLGVVAVFSMVLAYGHELRLFSYLYQFLPPFRLFRIPPRALVIWVPAVIMMGGIGLEALTQQTPSQIKGAVAGYLYRSAVLIPIGVLIGCMAGLIFDVNVIEQRGVVTALIMTAVISVFVLTLSLRTGALVLPSLGKLDAKITAAALLGSSMIIGFVLLAPAIPSAAPLPDIVSGFVVLILLMLAIALLLPNLHRSAQVALIPALVVGMTLIDMGIFGAKYVEVKNPPSASPDAEQVLAQIPPPPQGRFMAGNVYAIGNRYLLEGLGSIDGYYSGFLDKYQLVLRQMSENVSTDSTEILSFLEQPIVDERLLDFLNVTHVFSRLPLDEPGHELAAEVPGEYFVYRNEDALPRAFWVSESEVIADDEDAIRRMKEAQFDFRSSVILEQAASISPDAGSQASIEITDYVGSSAEFVIQVDASGNGLLVLSEPYFSERFAWIDGEPTSILRANVGFMAIAVPAGSHEVRLTYVPVWLYRGAAITLVTTIISVGLAALQLVRNRREDNQNDSA